jgi:hypothetical protein
MEIGHSFRYRWARRGGVRLPAHYVPSKKGTAALLSEAGRSSAK